jgi:hypothetical protein
VCSIHSIALCVHAAYINAGGWQDQGLFQAIDIHIVNTAHFGVADSNLVTELERPALVDPADAHRALPPLHASTSTNDVMTAADRAKALEGRTEASRNSTQPSHPRGRANLRSTLQQAVLEQMDGTRERETLELLGGSAKGSKEKTKKTAFSKQAKLVICLLTMKDISMWLKVTEQQLLFRAYLAEVLPVHLVRFHAQSTTKLP